MPPQIIAAEEAQFGRTLGKGETFLRKKAKELSERGADTLPGADAFFLWDTCGFPLDLTEIMAADAGLAVDSAGCAPACPVSQPPMSASPSARAPDVRRRAPSLIPSRLARSAQESHT